MSEERKKLQNNRQGGFGPGHGPMGAMGRPVEKPKNFGRTLRRLMGYFRPERINLVVILAAAILGTLLNILGPKILGMATTILFDGMVAQSQAQAAGQVPPPIDFAYIAQILLILIGLYLISATFIYAQQFIMAGVAQRTMYHLRTEVEQKLNRLPLKFFDSRTHGEILSRAVNDMDNLTSTLQQSVTQMITAVVTLVGVLAVMLSINLLLTVIVVLTVPLSLIVVMLIARRSQTYFRNQQRSLGILNSHVEEMYTGHKIVKAFGREPAARAEFRQRNQELYQAAWRAQFASGIIMPLMRFVGNIGYVLVAVVGGVLVAQGKIAIGDVQAFLMYAQQFSQPITQLANFANVIQSSVASAERVFELLDEPEQQPEAARPAVIPNPQGAVAFKHVRFGYSPEAILMEDMNIDVQPGQMVAIVGPTGAGKTTLVNLLMRFYEVDGGQIQVDGVNITDLSRGDLRCMLGMVLQDTWLFNGTIKANIGYGVDGATDKMVVQAAKAAGADHFIRTLPQGYDTVLNEEASNISQGQKQLLTIARAFLVDPQILILDEATSSVDTRTEMQIQRAMAELMKGRTSFVIAHRLSTIRDADLILVMNQGTIIEKGTHVELLEAKGFYADLYMSQFRQQDLLVDSGPEPALNRPAALPARAPMGA